MSYRGIILDPPWQYSSPRAMPTSIKKDGKPAKAVNVTQHYDTMTDDELCGLELPMDKDCLVFMWITNPKLMEGTGHRLFAEWGLRPITLVTWAKVQADGMTPSRSIGHWFRSASEHVMVGARGKVARPKGFPALATWFSHGRLPHSVKPTFMHDMMELAVPEGPWLEMFARRAHPGWSLWGNQAPSGLSHEIDNLIHAMRELLP